MDNKNIKYISYLLKTECKDNNIILGAINMEDYYLSNLDKKVPSEYYEIYDELDLIPNDKNIYDKFLNKLLENFDIDCNILEVGGGALPRLAYRISQKQLEIGCGTITVIDPKLSIKQSNNSNLRLYKEKFKMETNVDDFNLIIGIFPCEATDVIVKKSLYSNKDFFIRLCDCIHSKDIDFSYSQYCYYLKNMKEYFQKVIDKQKKLANIFDRKIEVIDDETPILLCKKK